MLYTKAKGILSSSNGMNLYRGCSHGCIYCDSRSRCYHIGHDFAEKIVVRAAAGSHGKVKRTQQIDSFYKGIGTLEMSKIYATRQK